MNNRREFLKSTLCVSAALAVPDIFRSNNFKDDLLDNATKIIKEFMYENPSKDVIKRLNDELNILCEKTKKHYDLYMIRSYSYFDEHEQSLIVKIGVKETPVIGEWKLFDFEVKSKNNASC